MLVFAVRRLVGMVAVLVAVSFFYVQYVEMMKKTFVARDLVSYLDQQNVVDRIREGTPATFAFFIVVFSTLVDVLYARLDPRVRPGH